MTAQGKASSKIPADETKRSKSLLAMMDVPGSVARDCDEHMQHSRLILTVGKILIPLHAHIFRFNHD
jgi:hypothetical protein